MRLKELMKEFNLKQGDFVSIGISRDVMANIYNERTSIDYKKVVAFAEFFDVSTDYFLGVSNYGIYVHVGDHKYSLKKEKFLLYLSNNLITYSAGNKRFLNVDPKNIVIDVDSIVSIHLANDNSL